VFAGRALALLPATLAACEPLAAVKPLSEPLPLRSRATEPAQVPKPRTPLVGGSESSHALESRTSMRMFQLERIWQDRFHDERKALRDRHLRPHVAGVEKRWNLGGVVARRSAAPISLCPSASDPGIPSAPRDPRAASA
jgi:hypothetical protein